MAEHAPLFHHNGTAWAFYWLKMAALTAATLPSQARQRLADDIARTVIRQMTAPEDGNDVAEA